MKSQGIALHLPDPPGKRPGKRRKGGGGKEMTGVGLGESSQGLQRREVTMQATGGEERVL